MSQANVQALRDLLGVLRRGRDQVEIIDEIRTLIANDDDALRVFVRYMSIEASLPWALKVDPILSTAVGATIRRDINQHRRRWLWYSTLAASTALVICALSLVWYFQSQVMIVENNHLVFASAVLSPNEQPPTSSQNLRSDDVVTIEHGQFADIYFGKGTVMKAYGPSRVRINHPSRIQLERGVVLVRVAKGDEGFTVATPGGEFLDLGTQFGVSVNAMATSEVHVFDGKVAVKADNNAASILLKGEAIGVTSNGQLEQTKPMDSWDFVAYKVPISAPTSLVNANYSKDLPQTIRDKEWTLDGKARLFCERRAIRLTEPLTVAAFTPGELTSEVPNPKMTTLPAGSFYDVYFLHCDSETFPVQGRIAFDHPIVGMSLNGGQLVASDKQCHRPEVAGYDQNSPLNGKRGSVLLETQDVLTMDPATNSFDFTLYCGPSLDQMRIFVAVPEPNL
ncbi:FecR family protein [Lacunimicrobium album]